MNIQTPSPSHGVPDAFLAKFGPHLTGILSGFDRLRFRGTLRMLFDPTIMEVYLLRCQVLIKNFRFFVEGITARVKAAAYQAAQVAGRPFHYLPRPDVSKEDLARQISREDQIRSGLIAVLSAVEPCLSYSVRGDRQTKQIHLALETRKCTHFYHYYQHPEVGLCHVRVQSWFPFTVDVCLNGREWLARPLKQDYYWSASQTEFATDLLFGDARSLAALYPQFLHHGGRSFASPDVLRFLGQAGRPLLRATGAQGPT